RVQALHSGLGRHRGRSMDRADSAGLRVSVECGRPSRAWDGGAAGLGRSLPPSAAFQKAPRPGPAPVGPKGTARGGGREPAVGTRAFFDAGYASSSRCYERAVPKLGMAPSVYRRGGAGTTIRYAIVDAKAPPLGRLLVGATDRGVCAVAMGSSDAELSAILPR